MDQSCGPKHKTGTITSITTVTSEPFRFFDMPRELRDEVYKYLSIDYRDVRLPDCLLYVRVSKLPPLGLQLVCRQITSEILKTLLASTSVELIDWGEYDGEPISLPPILALAPVIKIHIHTECNCYRMGEDLCSVCCRVESCLAWHRDVTLQLLANLQKRCNITINLYVDVKRYDGACEQQILAHQHLISSKFPHINRVKNFYVWKLAYYEGESEQHGEERNDNEGQDDDEEQNDEEQDDKEQNGSEVDSKNHSELKSEDDAQEDTYEPKTLIMRYSYELGALVRV